MASLNSYSSCWEMKIFNGNNLSTASQSRIGVNNLPIDGSKSLFKIDYLSIFILGVIIVKSNKKISLKIQFLHSFTFLSLIDRAFQVIDQDHQAIAYIIAFCTQIVRNASYKFQIFMSDSLYFSTKNDEQDYD